MQITKHGGYAAFEAPHGQSLFFSKQGQPGIWQLSFATGAVSQLTDALHPLDWSGWGVTDTGLYFLERKRPMIALVRRLDLHTHEATTITSVRNNVEPGYDGMGLTISPDERWILFGRVDQRSSDIMLIENF